MHTLTAISLAPGLTEVAMFGGCPKFDPNESGEKRTKLADTVILRLGEWNQLHIHMSVHCLHIRLCKCIVHDHVY